MANETLRRLAQDLEERGIEYAVIGAVALNQHGYQRFTHDIDLLMTPEGLDRFRAELVGRGYRPAFEGAVKTFRATALNVLPMRAVWPEHETASANARAYPQGAGCSTPHTGVWVDASVGDRDLRR